MKAELALQLEEAIKLHQDKIEQLKELKEDQI